jgi:thiosulfate/3-mercaptopyruvate sulfurtransferase
MKPLVATLFTALLLAQDPGKNPDAAAFNPPWTAAQTIRTDDLARMLQNGKGSAMQVVQVGFAVQYKSKHVPGSAYGGPASREAGLEELKKAVANVPKDRLIVLYCGCCPWDHCPNMKPAYKLLESLGYKQIKIVEIPTNFAKDWVDKGFPVEGSTAESK